MVKVACALLLSLFAQIACGQSWPEQSIRILVGFTPGTAPDVSARLLAEKLSEPLGKPVVVENVTGAGGNIGAQRVAKAAPDGYTLGMIGNGSLIFSPSMTDKLGFDPVKDFAPITRVFVGANLLVVPADSEAKSLAELIALARARPGKLTYAHAGAGTSQHLAAELFKSVVDVDIQAVAYRGTTALLPDLLSGRVSLSFGNIVNVLPLVREGKLRAFAVTSIRRSAIAPELPTMAESGYPGFEAVPWFGLMAPAGAPAPIVERLQRETVRVLAQPDVRKKLNDLGLDVLGGTPQEFSATIERELPIWAAVIKQAGIKSSD